MLSRQESNWYLLILEGCGYLYDFIDVLASLCNDFIDVLASLCNDVIVFSHHTVFGTILQIWWEKLKNVVITLPCYT